MAASSMAIPSSPWKKPTTGPLPAIPGHPTRTGCSSPPTAADLGRRGLLAIIIVAALASGLVRDAAPPRLSLTPIGFDALPGWADDDAAAALPALRRSCS